MSAEWAPLDERPGAGTPQCARRDDRQRRFDFSLCRGEVMVYSRPCYGFKVSQPPRAYWMAMLKVTETYISDGDRPNPQKIATVPLGMFPGNRRLSWSNPAIVGCGPKYVTGTW